MTRKCYVLDPSSPHFQPIYSTVVGTNGTTKSITPISASAPAVARCFVGRVVSRRVLGKALTFCTLLLPSYAQCGIMLKAQLMDLTFPGSKQLSIGTGLRVIVVQDDKLNRVGAQVWSVQQWQHQDVQHIFESEVLITCQQPVVPSERQQLDTAIEAVGAMEAAGAIGGENETEAVQALEQSEISVRWCSVVPQMVQLLLHRSVLTVYTRCAVKE